MDELNRTSGEKMKRLTVSRIEKILVKEMTELRIEQFKGGLKFKDTSKYSNREDCVKNDISICEIFDRLFKSLVGK